MDINSLPLFTLLLPVMLVAGAWLLSRLLRFSLWITLLVGCLPFALPYLELPFSKDFTDANPLYLIGGGWAFLVCLALGRTAVRPVIGDAPRSPGGMVRASYVVVLGVALLVVALLVSRPEMLNAYVPGWRGSGGLVLLCASLLSMSFALARVLRAALVFTVWAFVSLVLASELFLNKLPQEVVRGDLRKLAPYVSQRVVDDALAKLEVVAPVTGLGQEQLHAVVLGGSANTGFPYPRERSLAQQLRQLLTSTGAKVEMNDVSAVGSTIYQINRVVREKIAPARPDLVLLVGWTPDSEKGMNSYGMPGLTEREAEFQAQAAEKLRHYPFVEDILESTLYGYLKKLLAKDEALIAPREIPPRVPVDEYHSELSSAVKALRDAGCTVVLVPEAQASSDESGYRDEMIKVAQEQGAVFVPVDHTIRSERDPKLFARGRLLSDQGYEEVARAVLDTFRKPGAVSPELLSPKLVSLSQTFRSDLSTYEPRFEGLLGEEVSMLVRSSDVTSDILFKIRVLEEGNRYYRAVFSVNGAFVADRRLDSREGIRVRFKVPEEARKRPYVQIGIRTIASPPPDSDIIGTTSSFVPVPVEILARSGGVSMVKVGRAARFAMAAENGGTTNVAVSIDPRSGDVLDSLRTNEMGHMGRWILQQPWGTIVATSLNGTGQSLQSIRAALKYIGIAADVRAEGDSANEHSRAALGVAGIKSGEGLLKESKDGEASISLGSPILRAYGRFLLEDVTVNEKPLRAVGNSSRMSADEASQRTL